MDLDPLDLSLAGAAIAPTDKFLNGWPAPFKDCLHATIVQIAYPSFDLRFAGAIASIGAKAYPLDATGNKDMSTNEIHKPPVYVQCYFYYTSMLKPLLSIAHREELCNSAT